MGMLVRVSDWDQTAFVAQIETYRRELHVHCYRLMGSIQDADDMVQETLLRAWRRRESIEELSSLRAWLYKVATNICLDALKHRPKLRIPATHEAEAALTEPIPSEIVDPIWLEPYPDAPLLAANNQHPEDLVVKCGGQQPGRYVGGISRGSHVQAAARSVLKFFNRLGDIMG